MSIQLYNTLSQSKQPFTPIDPDRVTLYVCGPTVYNYVHIGNARPVVIFDVLYRLLCRHYPQVVYARNITDVDDKINKAAHDNGESIKVLSSRYTQAFHEDMASLHALQPTLEPCATDNIAAMITLIESLIARGHAYVAEQHVLFDVTSDPSYGCLSRRQREDMIAGARVEVAPYKRDPADFVLWKPSTDDLPGWESPWGRGRPGWHIECTAMINEHLGPSIDIHGGGQDLIFPHHENEIAQGRCAHGHGQENYVNYWMHNGYLTIDGEKMSKSLGNFFTVRELLAHWPGEVIRYALLTAHYRKPLDWSEDALRQAKASLDSLYGALRDAPLDVDATDTTGNEVLAEVDGLLCDDLATSQALSVLHRLAGEVNRSEGADRLAHQQVLRTAGSYLGLLTQEADAWFKWQPANAAGLSDANIDALVEERQQAKLNKDYARADAIRKQLKEDGIELEDTREGTRWTRASR